MSERDVFRRMNKAVILAWRLGLGPLFNVAPRIGGQVMVLTTIGRRSGHPRATPLNYARDGQSVYCISAYAGSDWYRNALANPDVLVWTPRGQWIGTARPVTDLSRMRQVLIASGLAAPMLAGIYPTAIPDDALEAETRDYRLLRVDLEKKVPASADLVWMWPALAAGLAVAGWLLRRK